MALEVLAIVAFIPALIDLGQHSLHFTKQLRAYHKDAGVLDREVEYYGSQIDEFANVIEMATLHLKGHQQRYPMSSTLNKVSRKDVLSSFRRHWDSVVDKLHAIESEVKNSQNSRFKAVRYIRWQRHCQDILGLIPQMNSIKTTISLLVEVARYESLAFEYEKSWDFRRIFELREDMKLQQKVIKVQLDIIKRLEDQLKYSKLDAQSRKHGQIAVLDLGKQAVTKDVTVSLSSDDSTSGEDSSEGGGPSAPRRPNGPRRPRGPRGPWRPRRPDDSDGPKTGLLVPSASASATIPDGPKPKVSSPVGSSDGTDFQSDDLISDTESDASTPAAMAAATSPLSLNRAMTSAKHKMDEPSARARGLQRSTQSVPVSREAYNAKELTLADQAVMDIIKKAPSFREKVLVYA